MFEVRRAWYKITHLPPKKEKKEKVEERFEHHVLFFRIVFPATENGRYMFWSDGRGIEL